jgi:RNA polymerase sigma-70 factor (ECF subfamily)
LADPLNLLLSTGVDLPAREVPAFDAIYSEHFAFVWRCARSLGVSTDLLDDVVQDVFLVVHRQLPTFRNDSTVPTWLYGILRRVLANRRRTVKRRGETEPLDERAPSDATSPLESAQDAEAARFVERFVATLDDRKRDVFVLALLEGLSIPEVARILSIPLNTAYTRLRIVRSEFRDALARGRP